MDRVQGIPSEDFDLDPLATLLIPTASDNPEKDVVVGLPHLSVS
jgi:hypothetical protein